MHQGHFLICAAFDIILNNWNQPRLFILNSVFSFGAGSRYVGRWGGGYFSSFYNIFLLYALYFYILGCRT